MVGPKHPMRYPKHDGDKGTVFGGVCNITTCERGGAVRFNRATYGYYCPTCAHEINWERGAPLVCLTVDHALSINEMDKYADELRAELLSAENARAKEMERRS